MRILNVALIVLLSALAFGGESPMSGYISCQSDPTQATLYFSSTYDSAMSNDGYAFAQFLSTKYGYKGSANCNVANKATTTIAHLQAGHDATVAQWRSNGKKVVDTGWTNNGLPALTAPAPEGPVKSGVANAPAHVPDPDDQPMAAKNAGPPPPAHAQAHAAAAPATETYVFCFSTGSPRRGTAQSHYYVTGVFAASNPHADGPFGLYLRQQHPSEENHAQCTMPGPLSTVENTRHTYIENQRKSFPNRDVVELNWKPAA